MLATTTILSGPGGAYLRVSDDDQEIATQRVTIEEFEQRHGVKIPNGNWFEDVNWSRDETDKRPEWLRMLADVAAGKIKWLVVAAKDRFGTASGRRKVLFYALLWDAGCKLILASTGEVLNAPDLSSDLNALVDGDQEERELRTKSERALEKMRQHAAKGRWMGGSIPVGLDVVCIDLHGTEQWRVVIDGPEMRVKISTDGSRARYDGKNNFPGRDKGQCLTLRPSIEPENITLVRNAFDWFDSEALSTYQIARRFADMGIMHSTGPWKHFHVDTLLTNLAYLGCPTWNRISQAKWSEHTGGVTKPHAERNTQHRHHDRADWIIPDQQFEPIIDPEQFDRVQDRLATRSTKPRAPKSSELWLSGLLRCQHCNKTMHGTRKGGQTLYVCASYLDKASTGTGCPYYHVKHDEAEEWLSNYFDETATLLPTTHATPKVSASVAAEWSNALHRMADAANEMRQRVGTWMKTATPQQVAKASKKRELIALDASGKPILHNGQFVPFDGGNEIDAKAVYRAIFDSERDQLQARLDQIETDHSREFDAWKSAPTERTKTKALARVQELETEIEQIEARLANAAEDHDNARENLNRLLDDWNNAAEALKGDSSNRTKAAAVRRVVDSITLEWSPTGRTKPAFYVSSVTIKPVGGVEVTANVCNVGSVARRPTASSAVTRACACGTRRSRSTPPPVTAG